MTDTARTLLDKMEQHIAANLNNEQFGVERLASMMCMSRSQLHRKLKIIEGRSISRFIREYRLKIALEILLKKEITASEVAHTVGFSSSSYFSKCFMEFYGYSPGRTKSLRERKDLLKSELRVVESEGIYEINESQRLTPHKAISKISRSEEKALKATNPLKTKRIIVLPFKNLSSNEENQYLADGMVDAISRHLSGIDNLNVIISSAATNLSSTKEIRQELNVTNIVKGSLQQHLNTIRLEIKLLDTSDGSQIWAQSYDRKVLDVLEIQNDISRNVARELEMTLSSDALTILSKRTSYNPLAYDIYLKGLYNINHIGDRGMDQAIVCFKKAIAIDPSIAPAYASMATYYQMKASIFSASIDSKEAYENAERYLDTALKLDKDWHFNYTAKAFQLAFFNWNFEEADKNYKVGLKAEQPLNYFMYRDFLQFENRHEEALKIAIIIDRETPFYPNSPLIMPYYYNGMFEEGEAYIAERLVSFPSNYITNDSAGFFMLNTGKYERAIEIFQRLIKMKGKRFPRILSWMGAAYAHIQETEKARGLLRELKEIKSKTDAGSPAFFVALVYSAIGEKAAALEWLGIAIRDHEMEVPWLVSEPQLYSLHGMPEFDALVKKVGFREHVYPVALPQTIH